MKRTNENTARKSGWFGAQGILSVAMVMALGMFFAAGAALAGDHSGRRAGDARQGDYESRIYGVIEKLPQGEVGTWIVNGREIAVTKDTRIKEKHGRAEAGAYVEVEGDATGKVFTAYEIEVKQSRRADRDRILGVIEKLPQGEVGIWVVNGREIVVTKDTRIREKHGRAALGATVEVEGAATGKTLTAYEIEVKRAR